MQEPAQAAEDIFARFSEEELQALFALPYRIGVFVSHADITGGWDAQEVEIKTLSGILREFAEDFCKCELSQKVLMESLRLRERWPQWSHEIDNVPDEAKKTMGVIESIFPEKTLRDFKEVMMDIAMAVAMAFREGDVQPASAGKAKFSALSDLMTRLLKGAKAAPLSHANISRNERAALRRLAKAMDYEIN